MFDGAAERDDDRLAELLCQFERLLDADSAGDDADDSLDDDPRLAERLRAARRGVAALERVRRRYLPDKSRPGGDAGDETLAARSAHTLAGEPSTLGRFRVQRELGSGGIGVVFLAYDPAARRQVAIKIPRPESLASADTQRRFMREAEAAARLNHPHVTSVYEVGQAGPICFLASEFCSGPTLRRWLEEHPQKLSPEVAARWLQQLASAVAHAHSRGVLHRDIKPSNVLLVRAEHTGTSPTTEAAAGDRPAAGWIPKLTDFGMAKLLAANQQDGDRTRTGTLIGTLAYMAPEQAEGRIGDIDVVTDVYGLGALLYELLTGRPPAQGTTDADTLRQVLFSEPVPPSRLRGGVPRDLDAICLKCLEKDPRRRYASAAALEADLGRYLAHQPIEARPPAAAERLWMWMHRHPLVATLSAICCLALLLLVGFGVRYNYQLQRHYLVERQLRLEAQDHRARAERSAQQARDAQQATQQHLYIAKLWRAHEAWKADSMSVYFALCEELQGLQMESLRDSFAVRYFDRLARRDAMTLHNGGPDFFAVTYLDEKTLVTGDEAGRIRLWDRATGQVLREFRGHSSCVNSFDVSADGRLLASASCDGTIGIWNIAEGQLVRQVKSPQGAVGHAGFLNDDQDLLVYGINHSIRQWDGRHDTWAEPIVAGHERLMTAVVSPDMQWVAEATDRLRQLVSWWPREHGRSRAHTQTRASFPQQVVFNHSSTLLAAVEANGDLSLWRPGGSTMGDPIATPAGAQALAFSHSDKLLAVAGHDLVVRLFDVESRELLRTFKGHGARIYDIAFSPDDREIAVATDAGRVKIWRVDSTSDPRRLRTDFRDVFTAALSSDARWLAVSHRDRSLRLYSLAAPGSMYELAKPEFPRHKWSPSFSGDSTYLLAHFTDGPWRVWDLSSDPPAVVASQDKRFAFDLSHSRGTRVAYATDLLVKPIEGDGVLHRRRDIIQAYDARFDPTGTRLVAEAESGCYLWDLSTDHLVKLEGPNFGRADACRISPAGDRLAIGFAHHVVLYRLGDGAQDAVLHLRASFHGQMAFSPDGQTLATATGDSTIQLWHVPTGQEMLTLDNDERCDCRDLSFSADGHTLYSVGVDGANECFLHAWPTQ